MAEPGLCQAVYTLRGSNRQHGGVDRLLRAEACPQRPSFLSGAHSGVRSCSGDCPPERLGVHVDVGSTSQLAFFDEGTASVAVVNASLFCNSSAADSSAVDVDIVLGAEYTKQNEWDNGIIRAVARKNAAGVAGSFELSFNEPGDCLRPLVHSTPSRQATMLLGHACPTYTFADFAADEASLADLAPPLNVSQQVAFAIHARDCFNESRGEGGDTFEFHVQPLALQPFNEPPPAASFVVDDRGNGTYSVAYRYHQCGDAEGLFPRAASTSAAARTHSPRVLSVPQLPTTVLADGSGLHPVRRGHRPR